MGRIVKAHCRRQFRPTPYPIPSKRYALEKVDWEQAICSVCLEAPHNAVLLLCSSHDKGCRPYMCGTSFRHSNCLDLFKKAYAKPAMTASSSPQEHSPSLGWSSCKQCEPTDLSCPLCRGEVKGWTVVEPARRYLNRKKRNCMQDGCSFAGTYKELKKHVKAKHRRSKPRKVDPQLEAKWRALEMQTAREDVLSTIRSSMPGAVVLGDYVIDVDGADSDMDDLDDYDEDNEFDDEDDGGGFFRRRRVRSNIDNNFARRYLYLLFQEGTRIARMQRETAAMHEDGGNSGGAVGFDSEGDDIHDSGDWSRGRSADLMRDGRRRQRPRQQLRTGRRSGLGPW